MTCHLEGVWMTRHPEGVQMTHHLERVLMTHHPEGVQMKHHPDNIFSMIEYIKTTRDDVWMTLALSVRKEHIKDHCR